MNGSHRVHRGWMGIMCLIAACTSPGTPSGAPAGDASAGSAEAANAAIHVPLALTRATLDVPTAVRPTRSPPPPTASPTPDVPTDPPPTATTRPSHSRGYLTTPEELAEIKRKASLGIEPYAGAVAVVMDWADKKWSDKGLSAKVRCDGADKPKFIDEESGGPVIYAKALAYHLTGADAYAEDLAKILEKIMLEARTIDYERDGAQCQLNFGWGTPELVAAADLIEDFWADRLCQGPTGTVYGVDSIGEGPCKQLFQNWLVKNPYYVVSETAAERQSNWGAAATNASAYVADYLWDRPEVRLVHRRPKEIDGGKDLVLSPAEAYAYANMLARDRSNGYRLEYASDHSCDVFEGDGQSPDFPPVKSQITPWGTIPEDARREEFCNIPKYAAGQYENYPQVHLGNLIQQCELMLRRGDRSCFDNIDMSDVPNYTFPNPDPGPTAVSPSYTTHLFPGRGSVERAIDAIIVDAQTEWRHESALDVAFRYYSRRSRFEQVAQWAAQLDQPSGPDQDICFGTLTHGFAPGEVPAPPPIVAPPQ